MSKMVAPRLTEMNNESLLEDSQTGSDVTPLVYICATLWHESEAEMLQMLKSIYR